MTNVYLGSKLKLASFSRQPRRSHVYRTPTTPSYLPSAPIKRFAPNLCLRHPLGLRVVVVLMQGHGVILLVFSCLFTRGLDAVRKDMDSSFGETPTMMARHGYASQVHPKPQILRTPRVFGVSFARMLTPPVRRSAAGGFRWLDPRCDSLQRWFYNVVLLSRGVEQPNPDPRTTRCVACLF